MSEEWVCGLRAVAGRARLGARGGISGPDTDAGLIEKFAESVQSPIPALRVVEKNLEPAVGLGYGNENASASIKSLEKSAGVEVKTGRAGRSKATKQND